MIKPLKTHIEELKAKGLKQSEIADKTGIAKSDISKLSRGVYTDIGYMLGKRIELLNSKTRSGK